MVTVRPFEPNESAALRRVRLAALLDTPSAFGSVHADELAYDEDHWIRRATASDESTTFAALDAAGAVIGLAGGYRPEGPGDVELVSMWTDPSARGQGVGRALVEGVIAWAEQTGAAKVSLWVTRGNDSAQGLYERCGFTVTGDVQPLPSDPCKDEIRMRLVVGR